MNKCPVVKNSWELGECWAERAIRLMINSNKIIAVTCCWNMKNILKEWTIDEFLNLKDIYNELNEAHHISPPNLIICPTRSSCNYQNLDFVDLQVDLSTNCNLKCIMCRNEYHISDNDNFQYEILNKIKGLGLRNLELTAIGEPFFKKAKAFNFIKSLTINDCKVLNILTNATLLTPLDIDVLNDIMLKTGIKINIRVSCDAIDSNTYSKIRIGGNFENVKNNILLLNKYNMLSGINFVALYENKEQWTKFHDYWRGLGIKGALQMSNVRDWGVNYKYVEEVRKDIINLQKNGTFSYNDPDFGLILV